jgi:two-component system phosphate regulon sensor histidine kinase PhoR
MTLPFFFAFGATIFFGIIAIIYTIKEHRLQLRLKEKEKFTAISLINSLEDAVCMIDSQNQISAINQSAKDLLNLKTENPTLTDLLSALPNTYNFHDKIQQTIASNQKIEEKEIHHQDKILNIIIYPFLLNPSDKPKTTGALLFIHDISKEKPLAKMKEDFTNIIVHELRSPLTSLKASSEMLNSPNNLTD